MELLQPVLTAHPEWFTNTRVVYDAEAVFAHRTVGLRKLAGNPMAAEEFDQTLAGEIRLASAANCVIAVSEPDAAIFRRSNINNVEVLGHALSPMLHPNRFAERKGLLFVGAIHEEDSPNGDSMIWFLTEVFPILQKKLGDEISLTIAGVNQSEQIRKLSGPLVRLAGPLEDLTDLYADSRAFIAPTRYAAGIPHKVHEAASRGLPVIATSLLAAQLGWSDQEMAIADDPADFAERCIEVYTTPGKWAALRAAAYKRVLAECAPETFDRKVRDILNGGDTEKRTDVRRFANVGMDR
jgi:glycosyltransferase involved in cell wall biosynthesis